MSEPYIVSARKYRPRTFETMVGQSHITTTLKNAIKTQQLAHAYLFCGPRGVGKTSCARILAKTINCENPTPELEACGQCSTCLSFLENNSFNVFELDAASNNSVDDIRRLTEQVRYAPQHGKYKIYIIDEVHMLSSAAFNAFLKTLEEPPAYAIFILATTEKHKILPTILSRCQIFDFKRIQTDDIIAHLSSICKKENIHAEKAALHVIAQKSEGCMRDALSMMDRIAGFSAGQLTYAKVIEHLNILDADTYFALADLLLAKDLSSALLYLDEILQKGFEGDLILNGFAEHFRNLLLSRDGKMARLVDLPEEHKRNYFNKAQIIPQTYVLSALSLLNDAELGYRNALNKRMHVELAIIRLCYLNDLLTVSDGLENIPVEKKKLVPAKIAQKIAVSEPLINARSDDSAVVEAELKPKTQILSVPVEKPVSEESAQAKQPKKGPPRPKSTFQSLSQIQESLAKTGMEQEAMVLSAELVQQLFDDFKDTLRTLPHELPAVAQLEMMAIECLSEDELQLICNSEMNSAYGQNKSGDLREFFQEKTGIKNIRITTFLDESRMQKLPKSKVMSKLEIFDKMAMQNPNLRILKDTLQLNVE